MQIQEEMLQVRDVMTTNLIVIRVDNTILEAVQLMEAKNTSFLLVKNGETCVGTITDLDIIKRVISKGQDPQKIRVGSVMKSPTTTISVDATIQEAIDQMNDSHVQSLVVEENHQKNGILTEGDILRITPELLQTIRKRLIVAQRSPIAPQIKVFAGFCEDCRNYSNNLRIVNGEWLCEECRA